MRERVECTEGADLSVSEIFEAYAAFCREMGWNAMPINEIHGSLEGLPEGIASIGLMPRLAE